MSNDLSKRERGKSLVIVEGDGEVEILEKLFNSFPELQINKDNIIVFHSNIYNLYDKIYKEYGDNFYLEDIDIPYVISKDCIDGQTYRKRNFINIFLIFDFDPQDSKYNLVKLQKLLCCLNDATNNGKIYMNFPMLESYKHILNFNQNEYNKLTVSYSEIKRGNYYKTLVERVTIVNDYFNLEKSIINCLKNSKNKHACLNVESLIQDIKESNNDMELKQSIYHYLDDKDAFTLYNYLTNGYNFQNKFLGDKNYNYSLRELFIKITTLNINKGLFLLGKECVLNNNDEIDIGSLAVIINNVMNETAYICVLNSMLFIIADYNLKLIDTKTAG